MLDLVDKERKAAHPEQPWLWLEEWAQGRVTYTGKGIWSAFLLTLTPHVSLWALVLWVFRDEKPEPGLLVAIVFFLIVTALIPALVLRAKWRLRKYGDSVFQMDNVPAILGSSLSGVVQTQTFYIPKQGFKVTLSCTRRRAHKSGINRTLWQHSYYVAESECTIRGRALAIPIAVDLPSNADRESSQSLQSRFKLKTGDFGIEWTLKVEAETAGIDYQANFKVPVFDVQDSAGAERLEPKKAPAKTAADKRKTLPRPPFSKIKISAVESAPPPEAFK